MSLVTPTLVTERLRLRPVARAFGHDSPYDPY